MKEFNEIIGYESVKKELERIADMMNNPKKYQSLGAKTTKGLILVGMPGVGKTLMANCLIKAAKRKTFIIKKEVKKEELVDYVVNIFKKAINNAPSIVFIDDMDKLGNEDAMHRNDEIFVTIQACIEDCKDKEVFVLATCNDINVVPRSLIREGRFDKRLKVVPPEGKDAEEIVTHFIKNKKCSKDVDGKKLAKLLNGKSCAQLETIINEAGVLAGYNNQKSINMDNIMEAFLRVEYNAPEDQNDYTYERALRIAYHEAGHGFVNEILEHDTTFLSVKKHQSEIEGMTEFVTSEDYFETIKHMENRMMVLLAGKAAYESAYNELDVGASSDIGRAFDIAHRIVDVYCMSGFENNAYSPDMSDLNKERREQEVYKYIQKLYDKTKQLIYENEDKVKEIAIHLANKKILFADEIRRIIGEVK